jgi:hypothetical protein
MISRSERIAEIKHEILKKEVLKKYFEDIKEIFFLEKTKALELLSKTYEKAYENIIHKETFESGNIKNEAITRFLKKYPFHPARIYFNFFLEEKLILFLFEKEMFAVKLDINFIFQNLGSIIEKSNSKELLIVSEAAESGFCFLIDEHDLSIALWNGNKFNSPPSPCKT